MNMGNPGTVVVPPSANVYTAMAAISFLATLGALIYVFMRVQELGIF